ncbi:CBS domain-containing protein [Persicitalea sp.]|uniref:CBS domain-containing protein n=1 Tax=Persicitalea sp. TaxID=3100273 RepID=UPI003593EBDA
MQVHQILAGKEIDKIWSVGPEQTVYDALEIMEAKNIGAVLVMQNGKMVGIFSERDYARKGILRGRASRDTLIRDVMTSKVITVETEQKLQECMEIMSDKHIRHLPVTQDGELVGIISINDIVTMIIREQRAHIRSLESYITGNPY